MESSHNCYQNKLSKFKNDVLKVVGLCVPHIVGFQPYRQFRPSRGLKFAKVN
jgi:hypothetical protein